MNSRPFKILSFLVKVSNKSFGDLLMYREFYLKAMKTNECFSPSVKQFSKLQFWNSTSKVINYFKVHHILFAE